ncbi:mechanosensitive ion channel [Natronorubrum sp. JWXQ-INN-674]|uniref:Mechanosensitive ion channel n=1 Tax=Natronorubrum halalkaliphilum TaxID=2691917 RepID=A0A6B0VMH0_9EURY|nr:mechanosensitive ion channel domain-containing protein [Natronorubrum halalkaliphilum]MXV62236.1 mechanosensitive ion channel [Natronorubrum halalkaliphilum]
MIAASHLAVRIPGPFDAFGIENPWLVAVIVFALSYVAARLVEWGGRELLERSDASSETSFNRTLFEVIHAPLYLSIGLGGLYLSFVVLGFVDSSVVLVDALLTAFVLLWTWAALRLGNRWIEHAHASETDYKFAPIFKNLWTIAAVLGAVLLLISIWNLEITPFLASAGILGIVLGLAAQETISNLIGGVSLYFDNTYTVGDVIELDDGFRGTVVDIGIRSTTVLTRDNVTITVPNSVLNSSQVVNQSTPQRRMRLRIPITAAYGTDYEAVERILLEVCEEATLIRDSPRPQVLFSEFGDSALVFELRAFVVHPLKDKSAVDQVNRGVYDRFAEAGITIPYPQRDLHFESAEFAPGSDPASPPDSSTLDTGVNELDVERDGYEYQPPDDDQ